MVIRSYLAVLRRCLVLGNWIVDYINIYIWFFVGRAVLLCFATSLNFLSGVAARHLVDSPNTGPGHATNKGGQ